MKGARMECIYLIRPIQRGEISTTSFTQKNLKVEAEAFFDSIFNHLMQSYGVNYCQAIVGGEVHVRR